MTTHLIQPRELFGPPERWDELRTCWDRNAGIVDAVTVPAGRTFAELFAACKPSALNIICNSDIHFDGEGIAMLRSWWAVDGRTKHCMALSRWDVRPDGTSELWDHGDSQDAWIFLGRPTNISTTYLGNEGRAEEVRLGVPGCDNAIAYRIKMAGYQLLNPSRTIKAYHLHNVQWRSYLVEPDGRARGGDKIERVPPPYLNVKPTSL